MHFSQDTQMASTRLITALFAVLLSGCVPIYSAPPRENNSTLKFSLHRLSTFLFYLNGENCTDTVGIRGEDSPLQNESRSLIVPSNKLVALSVAYGSEHGMYCNITFSFKLEPNKDYELIGTLDREEKSCKVAIIDLTQPLDDSSQAKINLKLMRNVFGWRNSCAPL